MNPTKDWQELTQITQGRRVLIERVRIADKDIAIEGSFELPQLARLDMDDQIFITAFRPLARLDQGDGASSSASVIRPFKARLTRIAGSLEFVETQSPLLQGRDPRASAPGRYHRRRCNPTNGGAEMIPFVAVVSLRNQESRTFRLWIPLFLVWHTAASARQSCCRHLFSSPAWSAG